MIDLARWSPTTLRRLNLRLFDDPEYQYDLDSLGGFDVEAVTRRRIANMKDEKIQALLRSAPSCPIGDAAAFRDWWAKWMPLAAGSQLWPDGNHRVGMMIAELVAEQAGFTMVLDEDDIDAMRSSSKALIQSRPDVERRLEHLSDPKDPLSQFYWAFRSRLRLVPVTPASYTP